jgi:hypothetical protein
MKTSLSLGLMFTALSTFAACSSDDEGAVRGAGGTSATTAGAGGQVAGGAGGAAGGAAGTTASGGTGGGAAVGTLGAALTIDADGNVSDTATGVDGGASFSSSSVTTVAPVATYKANGLCFKGTTATVPDANSYGTHWGAQLQLDLKRIPNPDAPPPAEGDAGADAGNVIGLIPTNWPEGNVIGFAYTLVGNDTAAADKGVPNAHFRFKALPQGASNTDDNYCSNRTPVSGVEERVLFSEINFECWAMGNYSLADDPIQYVQTPDPNKLVGTRPNPKALLNIAWQIASDLDIAPIPFDFCVTDLKPILKTP